MQTIEVDLDKFNTRAELLKSLRCVNITKGDTIKIIADFEEAELKLESILVFSLLSVISVLNENRKHSFPAPEQLLSHETLKELLIKEYGIRVEVEHKGKSGFIDDEYLPLLEPGVLYKSLN